MKKEDALINVRYMDICRRAAAKGKIDANGLLEVYDNEIKKIVDAARIEFIKNIDVCAYYAQDEKRNIDTNKMLHEKAGK